MPRLARSGYPALPEDSSVWSAAGVDGSYGDHRIPPSDQQTVPRTLASLGQFGQLHGVVRLPNGPPIVCGVAGIRGDNGTDWLDFYLPLGALGVAEPRSNEHMVGDPTRMNSDSEHRIRHQMHRNGPGDTSPGMVCEQISLALAGGAQWWDQIIWAIDAWHHYVATGDKHGLTREMAPTRPDTPMPSCL